MKCPSCGAVELEADTRVVEHRYKGHLVSVTDVTGYFCSSCGEVVLDKANGDRFSRLAGEREAEIDQMAGPGRAVTGQTVA